MAHVDPLSRQDLAAFEALFRAVEGALGFVPNSYFTMGRRPELLRAFARLAATILRDGEVDPGLKQLVALLASRSAGCRYCQAHTAEGAARLGVDPAKVEAAFDFETSPLFDDRERAALRLARDAALVPNATEPAHFEALRQHFSDDQVVEIVAVIALFGFLNRWNDTMATALEHEPHRFAAEHLGRAGWQPGKHAGA
ncbi:MAG: carboxymuconolactone decarboxylase family protein [Dehalococcoidia bacterium]